ncbi:MAG: oligosaccharide flippase family protein, partial [Chloroflexi bacterium]|nr:oligosaccharide flippase family protein [Chloroflexota bacterium]
MNLLNSIEQLSKHRSAVFAALSNLGYAVLNLLTFGLVARQLTIREYGIWAFSWSIITLFMLLADWGIGRAAARYLAPDLATGATQTRSILRDALILKLGLGVLMSLACLGLAGAIASITHITSLAPLLQIGSLVVFFWSLSEFGKFLLQGARQLNAISLVYLIEGITKLVFAVMLTSLYGVVGTNLGLAIGFASGGVVGLAGLLQRVYRPSPVSIPITADGSYLVIIIKYATSILFAATAGFAFSELGPLLLGISASVEQVGYYNVANNFARSLILAAGMVSMFVGPWFAQIKKTRSKALAHLFDMLTHWYMLGLILVCAFICALARSLIVVVFGSNQLSAAPILQLLIFGSLAVAMSQMYSSILDYFGQAHLRVITLILATILYFILGLVLTPKMGGLGVALAILISFTP